MKVGDERINSKWPLINQETYPGGLKLVSMFNNLFKLILHTSRQVRSSTISFVNILVSLHCLNTITMRLVIGHVTGWHVTRLIYPTEFKEAFMYL